MKKLFRLTFLLLLQLSIIISAKAQVNIDSLMPVRGFAIGAPSPAVLDSFIRFIHEELAPRKVNTLIIRIDYGYEFKSHPELREQSPLTEKQVKQIVKG